MYSLCWNEFRSRSSCDNGCSADIVCCSLANPLLLWGIKEVEMSDISTGSSFEVGSRGRDDWRSLFSTPNGSGLVP
jgi:hypothetical protein